MKLSYKGLSQKQIEEALENAIPQKPIRYELGGDYYYKCYWALCRADLKPWHKYCWNCGSKVDWSGYDDFYE